MSARRCEAGPCGQVRLLMAPTKCRRVLRFRSLVLCTAIIPFAAMIISSVGVAATSASASGTFVPIWQNFTSEPAGCSGPLTAGYSLSDRDRPVPNRLRLELQRTRGHKQHRGTGRDCGLHLASLRCHRFVLLHCPGWERRDLDLRNSCRWLPEQCCQQCLD